MYYSDTHTKQFRSQKVNQCVDRFYYELPSNMNYLYYLYYFSTMSYYTSQYAHVLSSYIRNYPLTLPKLVPQCYQRTPFHTSHIISYSISLISLNWLFINCTKDNLAMRAVYYDDILPRNTSTCATWALM